MEKQKEQGSCSANKDGDDDDDDNDYGIGDAIDIQESVDDGGFTVFGAVRIFCYFFHYQVKLVPWLHT